MNVCDACERYATMNKRTRTRAKRPSYRLAVEWIALNDNPDNGDGETEVDEYISTMLVADLFGKPSREVARDVMRLRAKT